MRWINSGLERLIKFLLPIIYLKDRRKKYFIYKIDDLKIKGRVNTFDKEAIYESKYLKTYKDKELLIKENDVVVDLGAHIGTFSIYAAKRAKKGIIYSYEPNKDNFLLLEENIKLNNLTNARAFNMAVDSKSGYRNFYSSKSHTLSNSFYEGSKDLKKEKVKTITLEDIIRENHIKNVNLLKIDVEGAEYDIVLNTSQGIWNIIEKVVIEYGDYLKGEYNNSDLVSYLKKCGFEVKLKLPIQRFLLKMGIIIGIKPQPIH